MKKALTITILCIIINTLLAVFPVGATVNLPDVVVSLQIDNPIMEVNGLETEIDLGRGTKPFVSNSRTLVPIRAIIEAFGGRVDWDESSNSVLLTLEDDTIKLVIDNNIAYLNSKAYTLDVAPTAINGRTMLPIRFVAESFNLGVGWDGTTQTITIIRNSFDENEYNYLMSILPEYSGQAYTYVNNNQPFFKDYEIIAGSFEYYSKLDKLGRCDVCFASVASDIMPVEPRGSISNVIPTGWINAAYEIVDGGYLYNRCHLIGYQLTGENANEKNLITGTRYLNIEGMLPFENMIDDYIEQTENNHVLYRVTPVFKDNNLVADGVLLEAYSVEDNGQGISFCVYCYNVQPEIVIDYSTGESYIPPDSDRSNSDIQSSPENDATYNSSSIYRTPTGKKYHFDIDCGGNNSYEVSLEEAKTLGLAPCSKCAE